ncbi:unnamed protein product, partial [Oncorhynchus mykiss]
CPQSSSLRTLGLNSSLCNWILDFLMGCPQVVRVGNNTSLCNWILDFLMGRPQVVRVGNNTSATLILNPGAPQGCVLSHLLYSLFTHDFVAKHDSNTIIKFADDPTVVGQQQCESL